MYLFFIIMQRIERSERNSGYTLSQNFDKVQHYTLMSRIGLITSKVIVRIWFLRLSKLKQILYLLIHILFPSKIFQNLKNIFDEFDKLIKSDAFLHDPKFCIAIVNLKEIFDIFLANLL